MAGRLAQGLQEKFMKWQQDFAPLFPACPLSTIRATQVPLTDWPTRMADNTMMCLCLSVMHSFVCHGCPQASASAQTMGCLSVASDGLGYTCGRELSGALRFYYSLTASSSIPPSNPCTSAGVTATELALPPGANGWLHAAITSPPSSGWFALAFAASASKMVPSQAIQGGVSATNGPYVNTYNLAEYKLPQSPDNKFSRYHRGKGPFVWHTCGLMCATSGYPGHCHRMAFLHLFARSC
jgi:hypothetical protein